MDINIIEFTKEKMDRVSVLLHADHVDRFIGHQISSINDMFETLLSQFEYYKSIYEQKYYQNKERGLKEFEAECPREVEFYGKLIEMRDNLLKAHKDLLTAYKIAIDEFTELR